MVDYQETSGEAFKQFAGRRPTVNDRILACIQAAGEAGTHYKFIVNELRELPQTVTAQLAHLKASGKIRLNGRTTPDRGAHLKHYVIADGTPVKVTAVRKLQIRWTHGSMSERAAPAPLTKAEAAVLELYARGGTDGLALFELERVTNEEWNPKTLSARSKGLKDKNKIRPTGKYVYRNPLRKSGKSERWAVGADPNFVAPSSHFFIPTGGYIVRPNSRSTRSYYFIWKLIEDSGRENLMKIWFNYAGVHARATQYVYGLTKLIIEENKWQPSRLQVIAVSESDAHDQWASQDNEELSGEIQQTLLESLRNVARQLKTTTKKEIEQKERVKALPQHFDNSKPMQKVRTRAK